MGWYIGNQQVGQVTVETDGGLTTNQAYLGLQDRYAIIKKSKMVNEVETPYYQAEIVIGVYANKTAKENGEQPISVKGLSQAIFVEISETEFITETAFSILVGKLIPAIEVIKPDWVGKLLEDF